MLLTYINMCMCVYVFICAFILCELIYIYIRIYTYIYVYIRIYTYIYTMYTYAMYVVINASKHKN